jgi:hypothetical protein
MYRDEEAAVKKLGKQEKEDMKESPFIVQFEYGANGEGYWTYESMIIQLEDCIDVVSALYPEYDFIFQFDHSCGPDRKRLDGLNSNTVRKGYSFDARLSILDQLPQVAVYPLPARCAKSVLWALRSEAASSRF